MSSLLHIDSYTKYNDVVNELQDYILDDENIKKSLRFKLQKDSQYNKDKHYNKVDKQDNHYNKGDKQDNHYNKGDKQDKICIPLEQDSLFWCYYILVNGDAAYEMLNNKNTLVTKQLKIDLVSTIRKNKDIIKTYKFDTITNIESNLANDNILNAKTFLSLCAIANINVIYISKKTYFESFMNDTTIVYVISEQINSQSKYVKKYGYQLANPEFINNIRATLYKLDKVDKPMKAMSAYKVEELVSICERLDISIFNKDNGKNKTKKDLYEAIIQYF
jgi:hypothetical protein